MFWIILAAQLASPVVSNPAAIMRDDDFPADAVRRGINRFVAFRTTVRPDGTIQDCTIERPSGDPKLDTLSCAIILKRAKFEPAKWIDGTPVYGVYRSNFSWTVGRAPSEKELEKAYPADMELTANMLQPSAGATAKVPVQIAVDEDGRVLG
jgi:TonB family protein